MILQHHKGSECSHDSRLISLALVNLLKYLYSAVLDYFEKKVKMVVFVSFSF